MVSVPFVPEASRASAPRSSRRFPLRRYATATLLFLTGLSGALVLFHAIG